MSSAVVFAYHDVGVRCLSAVLASDVEVALVVTHEDDPNEAIWFDSVARLASWYDVDTVTPGDPNTEAVVDRIAALAPDFLFSFYYRHMLAPPLLAIPKHGALNLHGSLLPKYRGRVPVNWAVIHGEQTTGASLHYMVEKPDAGDLVDQQAVPILPDDTAHDVFCKVTVAAEMVLVRSLPGLVAGTTQRVSLDLASGSYFGGRKPEDGAIDWSRPAAEVHNLVRGVAPPYPGAFTQIRGQRARVLRTLHRTEPTREPAGTLFVAGDRLFGACGDGRAVAILELEIAGSRIDARTFSQRHGARLRAAA